MKNSLLTAIALCCATSSTMPLWASAYENPKLETVEPNLATDGTGGLPCSHKQIPHERQ